MWNMRNIAIRHEYRMYVCMQRVVLVLLGVDHINSINLSSSCYFVSFIPFDVVPIHKHINITYFSNAWDWDWRAKRHHHGFMWVILLWKGRMSHNSYSGTFWPLGHWEKCIRKSEHLYISDYRIRCWGFKSISYISLPPIPLHSFNIHTARLLGFIKCNCPCNGQTACINS